MDKERWILLFILASGFLLRLSGVPWGVPWTQFDGWYHPDELFVFDAAIWSPDIILTTDALVYPTFFQHLLVLLALPLRLLFDSDSDAFRISVVLVGRFCNVLAGTGTIYVTYRISRDVIGSWGGLLASAVVAFSLYHVQNSAFGTTDVLTSFFLSLFLLFLRQAFIEPARTRSFVLAGISLGLLVGSKYTGAIVVVVVPVLLAHRLIMAVREGHSLADSAPLIWKLLVCGCVSVGTFAVTTPQVFADFPAFLDLLRVMAAQTGWTQTERWNSATWLTVYRHVSTAVGWPLTWLALAGLVLPVRKNVHQFACVLLLLAFFAYFGTSLYGRYVITVVPVIAIVAAGAAISLYGIGRVLRVRIVPVAIAVTIVVYSFGYCVLGAYTRYLDTRGDASMFLQHEFPAGVSLGFGYTSTMRGVSEYPRWMNPHADYSSAGEDWTDKRDDRWSMWNIPRIDFSRFRYADFLDYPDVIVLAFEEIRQIGSALRSPRLSKDYVWDERYETEWYHLTPPSPRVFAMYDTLLNDPRSPYTLARTFKTPSPVSIEFQVPEMRVYVASPRVSAHGRERTELSFANVHYYAPYSSSTVYYPDNPRGYFREADVRKSTWSVSTAGGSVAEIEFPAGSERIDVVIRRSGTGEPWHIQLVQAGVATERDARYVLNFRAKADSERSIHASVGRTHGAWDDVGLYQFVELASDWREFRFEFLATSDEDSARLFFDLGGDGADVHFDGIRLERVLADGGVVPVRSQSSFATSYRFNGLGCRGEDPGEDHAGVRRVVVLGNSWAMGAGVHEEDTWARRVETALNGDGTGRPWEILNCGVNDYDERKARLFYEVMAAQYGAELVLLQLAPRDQEIEVDVSRQYLPAGTQRVIRNDMASSTDGPRSSQRLDSAVSADQILQLARGASARGARLAVLLTDDPERSEWTRFADEVEEVVADVVPLLRVGSMLPPGSDREKFVVHPMTDHRPNELAHAVAADVIAPFVKALATKP